VRKPLDLHGSHHPVDSVLVYVGTTPNFQCAESGRGPAAVEVPWRTAEPDASIVWTDPDPNISRVYDHWLGGKDSFKRDRELGDAVAAVAPWIRDAVRANRAFLCRTVEALAREGADQFIDIGSGLPTAQNVHEVAQSVNPAARVVYVDRDPVVLVHARAVLATNGDTIVVEGDAREPGAILSDPQLCSHPDFDRPVAVLFVAVLHFLADEDDPRETVGTFRDAMAPGSHVVISHVTPSLPPGSDPTARPWSPEELRERMNTAVEVYQSFLPSFTPRTAEQVEELFHGFTLRPPGVVGVHEWPDTPTAGPPLPMVAGVGRLTRTTPATGQPKPRCFRA
jgi:S-adenosyl methyltransferase